jgi:hypothetical protein
MVSGIYQGKVIKLKKSKVESHTAPTVMGTGFNYGLGYKQKLGRLRGTMVGLNPVPDKKLASVPGKLG